jgi:hypothetical protein
MEVAASSKMLVTTEQTTQGHTPEDSIADNVSSLQCVTLPAALLQYAAHQTSHCGSKNKQH